jgi:hypothetical protein
MSSDCSSPSVPPGDPWPEPDDADAPPPARGPTAGLANRTAHTISFGQAVKFGAAFGLGFWMVGIGLTLCGLAGFALLVLAGFR